MPRGDCTGPIWPRTGLGQKACRSDAAVRYRRRGRSHHYLSFNDEDRQEALRQRISHLQKHLEQLQARLEKAE